MAKFQKGGNRNGGFKQNGPRTSFHKKPWEGGSREQVQLYKATCDECHKTCEVPFRPSQDKPVFCNDCFGSKRDSGRESFDRPRRSFDKPNVYSDNKSGGNEEIKRTLVDINTKLDYLVNVVLKLSPENKAKKIEKTEEVKVVDTDIKAKKELPKVKKVEKVAKVVKKVPATKKAPAKKKK